MSSEQEQGFNPASDTGVAGLPPIPQGGEDLPPIPQGEAELPASPEDENIIDMHGDSEHGQNKCPSCGASDISQKKGTDKLRCNFCRCEFDPVAASGIIEDLDQLIGIHIGSGAQNIAADSSDVITLKCQSCAAEVVISTDESPQARCHWCRNTLSLNNAVPNGAVPDVVLPFSMTKEKAEAQVHEFIKSRWFFANKQFRAEFTAENIFGVYLPYMIVDVNTHVILEGEGEILIRKYKVKSGNTESTRYDADAYRLQREFDLNINDLTVESSEDKLNHQDRSNTKNVINAIMPFDTQNVLKWNANYMKGYHSEKRDMNITGLRDLVHKQVIDIGCEQARSTIGKYDRGVKWDGYDQQVRGEQWLAAALPVWLYSYQIEPKGKLFYTAVNARTGETMGSVPINYLRLALVTLIICFLSIIPIIFASGDWKYFFIAIGPIFCYVIYHRYTNHTERHYHESETEAEMKNVRAHDEFMKRRTGLSNDKLKDATHFPLK